MNEEHDPSARLSCKEVFQVLKEWTHLVRIALGGVNYDGTITASFTTVTNCARHARLCFVIQRL